MKKLLFILLFVMTTSEAIKNSSYLMEPDDGLVTHVKHCLFHEVIYETLLSDIEECSFDASHLPPEVHENGAHRTDIPHNPECFGEHSQPLF